MDDKLKDLSLLPDFFREIQRSQTNLQLSDGRRVIALMSDFLPKAADLRRLLKFVYDSGAMECILNISGNQSNVQIYRTKAIDRLINHSYMDRHITEELIDAVIAAVFPELQITAFITNAQTTPQDDLPDPFGFFTPPQNTPTVSPTFTPTVSPTIIPTPNVSGYVCLICGAPMNSLPSGYLVCSRCNATTHECGFIMNDLQMKLFAPMAFFEKIQLLKAAPLQLVDLVQQSLDELRGFLTPSDSQWVNRTTVTIVLQLFSLLATSLVSRPEIAFTYNLNQFTAFQASVTLNFQKAGMTSQLNAYLINLEAANPFLPQTSLLNLFHNYLMGQLNLLENSLGMAVSTLSIQDQAELASSLGSRITQLAQRYDFPLT